MGGDGEKGKARKRGLASRSHILRLDIAERSFVSSAKLGYGSAVCLEKGRGERGRRRGGVGKGPRGREAVNARECP